ncbi:MAG: glycosyltransferase [Acidobacteria bacterium]|nr:glycosyltransferase [Acidobacteriota bacterium]
MSVRAFIVIPAYNESARLPGLLAQLADYLRSDAARTAGLVVHFCIVDDGSRQEQFAAAEQLVRECGFGAAVRLIRLNRNQGKGGAIRAGFRIGLAEAFDYLGFIDADCAVSVPEMHRALVYLVGAHRDAGVAGVIGSRVCMLGRSVVRNPLRHYLGRIFATFVSEWFGQAVYDTQCGLKIFEREALQCHLETPDDDRWVWDTELLMAMLYAGERIHEFPVDWREAGGSKVSMVRDPLVMIWHLVKFRKRLRMQGAVPRRSEIA